MSAIRAVLTEKAKVFIIDVSQTTSSAQPIETLVDTGLTYRCKFKPKRSFFYYLTGQVDLTNDIIITEREVVLNNILELDNIKYRIVSVTKLKSQGARGNLIIGFASKV